MSQFPPTGQPGGYPPNNPFGDAANPYARPKPGQGPYPPGSVKNWLVESIISLICCGGLFAIPAIVYAAQVNGKLSAGDYQGAVEASNNAEEVADHRGLHRRRLQPGHCGHSSSSRPWPHSSTLAR